MRKLLSLIAALAAAGPAFGGQAVTLRGDVASSDTVTLGDLFEGAGAAARVPIANRSGASVVLDTSLVQAAARRAGLDWANAEGLRKIVVHAGAPGLPSSVSSAHGNVEVLTYTRSLGAGEIVQPTDLAWIKVAAAPTDAPGDADMVIGQAAKRPLRAGAVALAHDTGAAMVIRPGDIVTVSYQADGVSLRLEGKSMGSAGVGESLAVLNTLSKRVVQTLVTGPGEAVVGPAAEQIKATRSLRYAAR